mgnify:FL=1
MKFNYPSSKTGWQNGVFYYSNGRGNYYEINKLGQIKLREFKEPIINLLSDRYGSLWISIFEKGLYRLAGPNNQKEIHFFTNTTTVLAAEDLEGGLWAHSYEEGLLFFPYPNYFYINSQTDQLLPDNVNALGQEKEIILIASSSGELVRYNYITEKAESIALPTTKFGVTTSIFKDSLSNVLWLSKRGKLFYHVDGFWQSFKTKKLPGLIIQVALK